MDKIIDAITTNRLEVQDANSELGVDIITDSSYADHDMSGMYSHLMHLDPSIRKVIFGSIGYNFCQNVETAVSLLRLDPKILGQTLYRAKYLEMPNKRGERLYNTALCRAIAFSLFGNCFTPTDEKLLLKLIEVWY
jgi:hypothetical protein